MNKRPTDDLRYHKRIFDTFKAGSKTSPTIQYVENNNAECGYNELALDYFMTTELVMKQYEYDGLSNWISQICFLVRQTIELQLKSLAETIVSKGGTVPKKLLFSHDLLGLWSFGFDWLVTNCRYVGTSGTLPVEFNFTGGCHEHSRRTRDKT